MSSVAAAAAELLDDRRLAVVAAARERVARLGVQPPLAAATMTKKRRFDAFDDTGSLVVRTSDCRLIALDSTTRYTIFGALMAKRPRRAHDSTSDASTCVVCMDDDRPSSVAVVDTEQHRCAIARRGAICVECTRRLLSQRSPLACPLCRHPITVDDIVVVERQQRR